MRGPRRLALFGGAAVVAVALATAAYSFELMRGLEGRTIDQRFSIRGPQYVPRDLVLIQIDDVTFDELNIQWPFPRSLHGRVIDRLRQAGAKAIAYDVQFTEPTEVEEDNALIDAVDRADNVVLATTEVDEQGRTNVFGGEEVLREIGARAGNSIVVADPGGTVRHMRYSHQDLLNFAIAAAEEATGRRITPRDMGGLSAPIDFRGPPGTIESVSFSRVLAGRFDRRRVAGRIAVVGTTAPSLHDLHATPVGGRELMSGSELTANEIHTALREFPLRHTPPWVDVLLIAVLGLVTPVASLRLRPPAALGFAVLVAAVFAVGAQLWFQEGWIVSAIYPLAALAVATVLTLTLQYVLEAVERQRLRMLFGRFVPDQVVDEVLACTDDDLRLGGREVTGTVLFADLRGFTSYSEGADPRRVIEALNVYLGAVTDAIMAAGGTLVGYMGDGVIAVFGAPIEQPDHADRALRAAREMTTDGLDRFNRWLRERDAGEGFRMGVGIHSGRFMSGNVGSEQRLEYTVIGDIVNTASRLEGMTKGTDFMVFVSEDCRAGLNEPAADLVFVDELAVRGRQRPVRVWGLATARVLHSAEPMTRSAGPAPAVDR